MVSYSCATYPLCMEWKTTAPTQFVTRRSPSIFLQGIEWNLELSVVMDQYELSMVSKKGILESRNYVFSNRVTTFMHVVSIQSEPKLLGYIHFLNSSSRNILWCRTSKQIEAEGFYLNSSTNLVVTCVFHSTATQLRKNPTAHVSTQSTLNFVDLQSLSRDFLTLLKDETFSDVKLKCASHTFSANRSVLAARSEVFAAMFRNKMAEKLSGVVHIKSIDPGVLELLLEYMYSAEKPDLCEETVHHVYEAADKYAVHGLRRACSDWMVERLTTDNCLDWLVLADKHSDENFKEAVACFVAEHLSDLSIESWSTFSDKYPLLVLSILKKHCEDSMPGAAKRAKFVTGTHCSSVIETVQL